MDERLRQFVRNGPVIAANIAVFRKTRSRTSPITSSTSSLVNMAGETTLETSPSLATTAMRTKSNLSGVDPESGVLARPVI